MTQTTQPRMQTRVQPPHSMELQPSVGGTDNRPDDRLIGESRMREVFANARKFLERSDSVIAIRFVAGWAGEFSWVRNRTTLASDRLNVDLFIQVQTSVGTGQVRTNQIGESELRAAVRTAEWIAGRYISFSANPPEGLTYRLPLLPYPDTRIWSDGTPGVTPEQRGEIVRSLTQGAEAKGMLSAGYLQMRIGEQQEFGDIIFTNAESTLPEEGDTIEGTGAARMARVEGYVRHTEAQCSMTVRESKGRGSGWAGLSCYDWIAIDGTALADRALDLCIRSLNPVRIEPGRYTVVLQPQAVAELVAGTTAGGASTLGTRWLNDRFYQENPRKQGPFFLGFDRALEIGRLKLGLKVVDERITIRHDPMHPQLGIIPALGLTPVTWIEHGVLRALGHQAQAKEHGVERRNALRYLQKNVPILGRYAMEMTGGSATVEDMIRSTKRGLLVTRLSNLHQINYISLLHRGITRDGLWLIEDGKITKAVNNMWFSESPLFVLNQVVDLGVPVPVFRPGTDDLRPALIPPVKANDFSFTMTSDAV